MKGRWGVALAAACLLVGLPVGGGTAARAQDGGTQPGLTVAVYGEEMTTGDCDRENPDRPPECTGDLILRDSWSSKVFDVIVYSPSGHADEQGVGVTLSFTAQQIAAAGFTSAADFTARLHGVTGVADRLAWTVADDGTVSLRMPPVDVPSGQTVSTELYLSAAYSVREGTLDGAAAVADDSGATAARGFAVTFFKRMTSTFLGRDANGDLHVHQVGGPFYSGVLVTSPYVRGQGWNDATALLRLGEPRDSVQPGPYVLTRSADGLLRLHKPTGDTGVGPAGDVQSLVGWGYDQYDAFAAAGDVTGDGTLDFVARDRAGRLFRYDGLPGGTGFAARVQVGWGWQIYDRVIGGGDLDGDGRPDLLARDRAGDLWYYRGTGVAAAPYAPRQKIGWGWNVYDTILVVGPCDYTGHACMVARDSRGRLWGYQSTGTPQPVITGRVQVGWGYGVYTAMS